jgi:site-specific DNA-cytosine methylase
MKKIRLLMGGSPCTHWSIAQKNNRETTAEGLGWELFKNFLIAKEKFKPDYFLYENNKSMADAIRNQIDYEFAKEYLNNTDEWELIE